MTVIVRSAGELVTGRWKGEPDIWACMHASGLVSGPRRQNAHTSSILHVQGSRPLASPFTRPFARPFARPFRSSLRSRQDRAPPGHEALPAAARRCLLFGRFPGHAVRETAPLRIPGPLARSSHQDVAHVVLRAGVAVRQPGDDSEPVQLPEENTHHTRVGHR